MPACLRWNHVFLLSVKMLCLDVWECVCVCVCVCFFLLVCACMSEMRSWIFPLYQNALPKSTFKEIPFPNSQIVLSFFAGPGGKLAPPVTTFPTRIPIGESNMSLCPKFVTKVGQFKLKKKYERSIKLLICLSSAWYWLLKFVYRKIVADVVFC